MRSTTYYYLYPKREVERFLIMIEECIILKNETKPSVIINMNKNKNINKQRNASCPNISNVGPALINCYIFLLHDVPLYLYDIPNLIRVLNLYRAVESKWEKSLLS